ncbi:MAG: hypothetical protein H7256_05885 [Bdellovibrio sp.]|nr:hypothetical protein [Bdellovibrio sp.]
MKHLFIISLAIGLLALSSCNSTSTDGGANAEVKSFVTLEASKTQAAADPKVNVLFVVDNSGSMKSYQEKLSKNMRLFSDKFFTNARIDYRIGVVPIYDSKYLNDKTVYRSGVRKMNALAELVSLKGLTAEDDQKQLFITRKTLNPKQVLEQTVAIGVQWGPEAEESFSPVLAIADPVINKEKNQGFYEDDAYLAVVFLTDADDVTPGLSGDDFYQRLVDLKGGDRSKILIAAALPNLNNHGADCTKDGQGPLQSFPSLLAASGALVADLCSSNFGSRLADFGGYLAQRVAMQKIALNFTPDIATLQVSYGEANSSETDRVLIPRGTGGYLFNPDTNEVIISSNFNTVRKEHGVIFVKAIPADLATAQTGL